MSKQKERPRIVTPAETFGTDRCMYGAAGKGGRCEREPTQTDGRYFWCDGHATSWDKPIASVAG